MVPASLVKDVGAEEHRRRQLVSAVSQLANAIVGTLGKWYPKLEVDLDTQPDFVEARVYKPRRLWWPFRTTVVEMKAHYNSIDPHYCIVHNERIADLVGFEIRRLEAKPEYARFRFSLLTTAFLNFDDAP